MNTRKIIQLLFTSLCWAVCISSTHATDDIQVKSSGMGMTEEDATKKALVSAVEQAVGVLAYSKVVIKNEEVEVDSTNTLSNGFVSSYKKLSAKKNDNGTWSVNISAMVRKGKVADFLKREGITTKVDLKNNWAQLSTGLKAKRDALKLFHAKVPEIKAKLFKVQLVDLKTGAPVTGLTTPYIEEDLDGNATCVWVYRLAPDIKFWKECAHPLLEACFKTLSVGHKTLSVRYGAHRYYGTMGKKKPQIVPNLKDIYAPRLSYAKEESPGFHPRLFDPSLRRPYQGELKYNGTSGLYSVVLENPTASQHSSATMFYFSEKVHVALFDMSTQYGPHYNQLAVWSLKFQANDSDGNSYEMTSKDRSRPEKTDFVIPILGAPSACNHIPPTNSPLYFGPWIQADNFSSSSSRQTQWPNWVDASCYSNPSSQGWPFVVLHGGKPYPVKRFYKGAPPFAEWIYIPVSLTIPLDSLPKINRLNAILSIE